MKTIIFDELKSTNEYAKEQLIDEDTLIVAKRQTGGKGTKGRAFSSDEGGIYLSLVRINAYKSSECFKIMITSALAVVYTLKAYGLDAKIKWPNDVFVNGKKICGILIENVFCGDSVSKSIIGIGLNVNNTLPSELVDIATTYKAETGKSGDISSLLATLTYNLYREYDVKEYIESSCIIGKKIKTITQDGETESVCKGFTEQGQIILDNGKILSAGEVTIK